jgi:hypothetical protein
VPVLPALGGKLNSTTATLRCGALAAAQRDQLVHARGQHVGALDAAVHVVRIVATFSNLQPCEQPVQASAGASPRPPNTIGPVAPSSSGIATMIVLLDRQQAAVRGAPLVQRLELDRVAAR